MAKILPVLCVLLMVMTNYVKSKKKKKELEVVVEYRPGNCQGKAANGDIVLVHYTGMLENGRMFDSSLTQGRKPIEFELGKGKVIKGWEEGIRGMCIGEKRKLTIPPHLGYGASGVQNVIPPNSYLIFTTELIDIKKKPFLDLGVLLQIATWPALALVLIYVLYKRAKDQSKQLNPKSSGTRKKKK